MGIRQDQMHFAKASDVPTPFSVHMMFRYDEFCPSPIHSAPFPDCMLCTSTLPPSISLSPSTVGSLTPVVVCHPDLSPRCFVFPSTLSKLRMRFITSLSWRYKQPLEDHGSRRHPNPRPLLPPPSPPKKLLFDSPIRNCR